MNSAKARLAALAAVVMWGASFAGVKLLLPVMPAILIIIFRGVIGVFSLLILAALVNGRISYKKSGVLILFAFVGMFAHQLLQTHGLKTATASASGMIVSFVPVWTAIVARIFLREKLGAIQWAGIFVAGIGVVIVMGGLPVILNMGKGSPEATGLFFVLLSTLTWAIYTVLGRWRPDAISTLEDAAYMMFLGILMLAVFAPWGIAASVLGQLSFGQWAALLFLGIFASGIAFWLWNISLKQIKAAEAASLLHLEPLVAAGVAVWWLNEVLTPRLLLGGVVIIFGVALVQKLLLKNLTFASATRGVE